MTVVWINGAFGAGKTTTARELIELIPNSTLFDPEVIGGALAHLLPPKRLAEVGDFQDLPIWRRLVIDTAAALLADLGGTLVVPMTLLRQEYRDEIFGGLAARRIEVRHVLLAPAETILRERIASRGTPDGETRVRQWSCDHIEPYRAALASWLTADAHPVDTGALTPYEGRHAGRLTSVRRPVRPRRRAQHIPGPRGHRIPVTETGHLRVEGRQPPEGGDGPVPVEVEHAEEHPAVDRRRGDRVPREQHTVGRQVQRDAPVRVARRVHDPGAAPEVQDVTVLHLGHPGRPGEAASREPAHGALVQRTLPVLEHGRRTGHLAAHDGRLDGVRHHLGPGERGDLLRPARVVLVEVGEHDTPYAAGGPRGLGDARTVPGRSGVDERHLVAVTPEIGLTDRETQQTQAREEFDDVHTTTVGRAPPGGETPLPTAEPGTGRRDQLAA
ncbi:hypothetical protein SVIOM342S_09993 [Streptomyces violaceorubidus]